MTSEKMCFKVNGDFLTDFVRGIYWDEDFDKGLKILKDSFPDMTEKQCINILYGKKKLIGINDLSFVDDETDFKKTRQDKIIREFEYKGIHNIKIEKSITTNNGWLSHDGRFYPTPEMEHSKYVWIVRDLEKSYTNSYLDKIEKRNNCKIIDLIDANFIKISTGELIILRKFKANKISKKQIKMIKNCKHELCLHGLYKYPKDNNELIAQIDTEERRFEF